MKRKFVGFLLCIMVFLLAACASQDKVVESTAIDIPEDETSEGMGIANPWIDSDQAGVFKATGFDLIAPAGAANAAYSYMPSTGMAQLNYTMDHAMWVYRVQPTDALEDISGIYCEWNYTWETKVAGMDAMEYSYASNTEGDFVDNMECTRVINWYDAQSRVTHSLSVIGTDLNSMDTAVYAENLYKLNTGDTPDREEAAKGFQETDRSYLGLHVSSYDGSEILVEEGGENGRLNVSVSLYRLCSLDDGVGIYENGVIRFEATDPSGNIIRCCLYYDSNISLCMEVEESTWEYLPTGTVIHGFDN